MLVCIVMAGTIASEFVANQACVNKVFEIKNKWLLQSCVHACTTAFNCKGITWIPPGTYGAGRCIGCKDMILSKAKNHFSFNVPIKVVDSTMKGKIQTGVYEQTYRPELMSVALVTASNIAYRHMLQNWECWAAKHHLQWNVLVFDAEMEALAGPNALMLPEFSNSNYSKPSKFREQAFNKMSCAKLQGVLELLKQRISVVFSDPDNIFVRDPFNEDGDFAALLADARVEYVYSLNGVVGEGKKNGCPVNPTSTSLPGTGDGNTGFYFARATPTMIDIFETTLFSCKVRPTVDDQTVFWDVWKQVMPFTGHCDGNVFRGNTTKWCCLSPNHYATGRSSYASYAEFSPVKTYHANFAIGMAQKFDKLKALPINRPHGGLLC